MAAAEGVGPPLEANKTLKTGKQLESMNEQNYSRDKNQLLH